MNINERVRAILAGYTAGQDVTDDMDFREAGLDSVEMLEFFAEIEASFGIHFREGDLDLATLNSIEAVSRLVERRMP